MSGATTAAWRPFVFGSWPSICTAITVVLAGVSPISFLDLPATAASTHDAAAVTFDPLPLLLLLLLLQQQQLLLLPSQIDQLLLAREAGLSHAPAADC